MFDVTTLLPFFVALLALQASPVPTCCSFVA